jgi:quinol monooxygenase YgiN
MMIGVIAMLKVAEGKNIEFEAVVGELVAQVRANEEGVLAFACTKSRTDPQTYKFLELYTDEEALTLHAETEYFKAAGPKLGPCLAGRPEIELLDGV